MAFGTRSSSSTCDVFLSFKGSDTLYGFTGTLCNALREREINIFIDRSCEEGEEITPASTMAIEECKIAIILFSNNYAFSRSCLDELVYILERSKEQDLLVIPVFYNLDPSDVRHQKSSYGEALAKHQQSLQHNMDKLQKWKKALRQVADICGFHFKEQEHGYEYKCIDSIVERVSDRMNLDLLQVGKILNVGHVDGVHMLGFGRIDGMGKTTLAPGVYNLIVGHFDGSCFIQKDAREKSNKYVLNHIQSIHLSKIVGEKEINLASGNHQLNTGFGRTDLFHLKGFGSRSSTYDVFLSFRGDDTRYKFSGNLYNALHKIGIRTFFDDDALEKGEEITRALLKAIQESRIAIIVLSKGYASSSFCLDELVTILHCAISTGLTVIPVFYNVDPSVVRHLNDSYGEAFAKHEERFKPNTKKLENWKMSLRVVADLSGYRFNDGDGYEHQFISRIADSVYSQLEKPLCVADYPVGLLSRVQELMKLLDVESDDGVRIIGIHGRGGIGKSTLARAAYNYLLAQDFDFFCYLENVRHQSNQHGLQHLQSILLSNILGDKNINITSVEQGISMIEERLRGKKVLLLIDDVDHTNQLKAIVGRPDWFGLGSRVIITTRDKLLLKCHKVQKTYEVQELNEKDALRLLTWKAFNKEKADPTYVEVLNRIVWYASGVPLTLEVIGSSLSERSVESWKSAVCRFKQNPSAHILCYLEISFDTLQGKEIRSVFLDIACCFEGYKLQEVEVILNALYGHNVECHIGVLVDKSLIKVNPDGRVKMHDLIQDMGREIVRKESTNPGKRRILWSQNDIIKVLQDNTGTNKIEIIYLDVPVSDEEETIEWNGEAFMKMKNLKVLIIKIGKFSEGPKCLPSSLRVLEWWGYPSHSLPSDFQRQNLVICKLFNHLFHPVT